MQDGVYGSINSRKQPRTLSKSGNTAPSGDASPASPLPSPQTKYPPGTNLARHSRVVCAHHQPATGMQVGQCEKNEQHQTEG